MHSSLERVLNPRSIAIVGASETPGKAAERRTRSLIEGGYRGRIFPVNPKRRRIFSLPTYPSVSAIEEPVDLVVIIIPPPAIPQVVRESVEKGAQGIVIITAGLGETGNEGKQIEAEVLEITQKAGVHLIGPNCSGMFSASASMNFLGIPGLQRGHLSVVAQSGNVIDSLSHYARNRGLGFSKIISIGNAVGVKLHDYLRCLKDDPDTRVILLYLEGIQNGNDLIQAARETVAQKPIVALKVGRTSAGIRAAASHTGSLTGDDTVVSAAFRQAGIVRVNNVDELFDVADVLAKAPYPRGRRVAILSEGGGDNAIAADNAERHGLQVPVLGPSTQEAIRPFLLEGMPAKNPIDYGGTAEEDPPVIPRCCQPCLESDDVDAIFITGFFGGFREIIAPHVGPLEEEAARELVNLVKKFEKPIVVHSSFARDEIPALQILREGGIPLFESSERAALALAALADYALGRERARRWRPLRSESPPAACQDILHKVLTQGRNHLTEPEALRFLELYGIPTPAHRIVSSEEEAAEAAGELGYPVALKVISPHILHKSDVGGVALDLADALQVKEAFRGIHERVRSRMPEARIEGILVVPMVQQGMECIVGAVRDPQFGPMILFGLGGIFVEVLRDVSFRVLPLGEGEAGEMIREIQGFPLLQGVRGHPPKDILSLEGLLERVAILFLENPQIREMDLNPVKVQESGATVLDVRLVLEGP
jgi:acetyltransferase